MGLRAGTQGYKQIRFEGPKLGSLSGHSVAKNLTKVKYEKKLLKVAVGPGTD